MELKLIGESDRIARELIEIRCRFPTRSPLCSRRTSLGDYSVDEVCVFSSTAEKKELRQSFWVGYQRQSETNHWLATTTAGPLHRGMDFKGVAGQTSARWPGQADSDEESTRILVLLEVGPRVDSEN